MKANYLISPVAIEPSAVDKLSDAAATIAVHTDALPAALQEVRIDPNDLPDWQVIEGLEPESDDYLMTLWLSRRGLCSHSHRLNAQVLFQALRQCKQEPDTPQGKDDTVLDLALLVGSENHIEINDGGILRHLCMAIIDWLNQHELGINRIVVHSNRDLINISVGHEEGA